MEEPQVKYKNRLRNILTIAYWAIVAISAALIIFLSNLIQNSISIIILSLVAVFLLLPTKILKIRIDYDMIVFDEWGAHPTLHKVFGVAFDNIHEYHLKGVISRFYLVELKRKNGKNIRKIIWFTTSELSSFLEILNEKTNIKKCKRSETTTQ